jgi:hypothetical protein
MEPFGLSAGPLRLRPWRPDDVDAVWAVFQDPDLRLWNGGGVATRDDAEIGYWTAPAARGRGVAAVAVDAGCRWAFAALPVDRIELCHAVENTASGRVAQKAGFTYEGHLRRSYRYGDGLEHDELLWSRLSDDPAPEISIRS